MKTSSQLIKQFQEKYSKELETELIKTYYISGCHFALKHLSRTVYSNLIKYENDEIMSYVYLVFRKALSTYKTEREGSMSFKTYFYQLIKFQTMKKIRTTFNWAVVPDAAINLCKKEINQEAQNNCEQSCIKDAVMAIKFEKLQLFLKNHNPELYAIFNYKGKGLDNRDIAKIMKLTPAQVKSKCQYIKNLILKNYPTIDDVV